MQYHQIFQGTFLKRPNRFLSLIDLEGQEITAHVKNTGRCRELLLPGATVYLAYNGNLNRKTQYDLIAVRKGGRLINIDAQAPNKVFGEWALRGNFLPELICLKPETTWGHSRFDFYWESRTKRGFVEVKGVTLENGGAVYFPDAPTERGVKHVEELISCKQAGYEATLFLVVQMEGASYWAPNDATHPEFGAAVRRAVSAGVKVLAYDCKVAPNQLEIRHPVPVRL